MEPIDVWPLVLTALPAIYLAVFVHELGHAVVGRVFGYIPTSFGLGVARPLLVVPVRGCRIYFCRSRSLTGLTFSIHRTGSPTRAQTIALMAGGGLFNAATALLCLGALVWGAHGQSFWMTLGAVSALFALSNLVPFRFKVGQTTLLSDGAQILQVIRHGGLTAPPTLTIQSAPFVQALAAATGDRALARLNLLATAGAWIDLEDYERAEVAFGDAAARPVMGFPALDWIEQMVNARLALARGRAEEAAVALERAERTCRTSGNRLGALMVSLMREHPLLGGPEPARTGSMLEDLRHVRGRPNFALMGVAVRLDAALAASSAAAVDHELSEYERLRERCPSPASDLHVYRGVARFHGKSGDWVAAEPCFRRAWSSVAAIADSWADPAERARFLERQEGLATELRLCLETLGKGEEAGSLVDPTFAAFEPSTKASVDAVARNRRFRRAGLRVLLANAAVLTGFYVWHTEALLGLPNQVLFIAFQIAFFSVIALLWLFFDLMIARLIPVLRTSGGAVFLLLSLFAWLTIPVTVLLTVIDPFLL